MNWLMRLLDSDYRLTVSEIDEEIRKIYNKPCYAGWSYHALFVHNGDSQRFHKLRRLRGIQSDILHTHNNLIQ